MKEHKSPPVFLMFGGRGIHLGNEIPHIEKFGLQLIVVRGAKNIGLYISDCYCDTDMAITDNRHNDTPVRSCR